MSVMFHSMTPLWFLKTFNSLLSCKESSLEDITTRKVSSGPKKAYLSSNGKGFTPIWVLAHLMETNWSHMPTTPQISMSNCSPPIFVQILRDNECMQFKNSH